jgi:hypothetical protein
MRKGASDKQASEPRERVVAGEGKKKKKKTGERSGDAKLFCSPPHKQRASGILHR